MNQKIIEENPLMNEIFQYLRACGTFFMATADGEQPRVRPFGAIAIFEGKFYFQTGNNKKVFEQMKVNPKIEICAMNPDRTWIRITATAVQDDRYEARKYMIEENPGLERMYAADDGICEVLYLKDATATIYSFTEAPKTINF